MNDGLLNDGFPFADSVLDGQTALVCGASKGIGRACALMLARAGARVVACARSVANLDSLVAEMHGDGHEALALDLENLSAVREAVSKMGTIHILVNNSGGPPGGPLLENTLDEFEGPFRRHLHAAHTITQALVPGMETVGTGRIVNIISTSLREPRDPSLKGGCWIGCLFVQKPLVDVGLKKSGLCGSPRLHFYSVCIFEL